MSETPSKLMYTFVILVFILGAMFMVCHRDYRTKKFNEELADKTETEQVVVLKRQIKYLDKNEFNKIESNDSKKELMSRRDYILHDTANGLVTVMIMAFFVIIAICIAIFKYVAMIVMGVMSLKNIKRNV